MSNHTTVSIRESRNQKWRNECRQSIRSCVNQCNQVSSEINATRNSLYNMERAVSSLRNQSFSKLNEAGLLIKNAAAKLQNLENEVKQAERESINMERAGRQKVENAATESENIANGLATSDQHLESLTKTVTSELQAVKDIGSKLETLFQDANNLTEDIENSKSEGQSIENNLSETWSLTNAELKSFSQVYGEWSIIKGELDANLNKWTQQFGQMALMIDSLKNSEAAAYTVLQNLIDQDYNLIQCKVSELGVEAFLKDSDERVVAFMVSHRQESSDDILLELDISDCDMEGGSSLCDELNDIILDDLGGAVIIDKSHVSHPDRRKPGGLPEIAWKSSKSYSLKEKSAINKSHNKTVMPQTKEA